MMHGWAILLLLIDTLLGTLVFVIMATLIKAWTEREEVITEKQRRAEPATSQPAESKA
jgi:hypothetical protein